MRKSSKSSKGSLKMEPAPPSAGMDDVKVKAVNEMMERIKHGVVLRPVKGQDTKRFGIKLPPAGEEKQQESAMEELKGILVRCEDVINPAAVFAKETVKRSPSRGFPEALPSKRDSELEVILRRRRKQACDATAGGDARSHGNPTAPTAPRACPETTPNPSKSDEKDSEISKVSSSESLNARHSSDSGKEAWGPRRGGSTRSSSSDKGISELFANGSCDSGEEEKTNEEKPAPAESNGENHTVLNQEKQAMLTPGSPDGVSPLIGGTDAEC